MKSKVWTNYLKSKGRRFGERRREGCALESFRDERERAFRRMVHYQGQYPGCSTTLLTISPNYYTLYLPHSPLSYFPLSPLPPALVLENPFASSSDNYVPQEFPCDSQSQIDKEDIENDVFETVASSFRLICLLNNRVWIYRVSGA